MLFIFLCLFTIFTQQHATTFIVSPFYHISPTKLRDGPGVTVTLMYILFVVTFILLLAQIRDHNPVAFALHLVMND